MPPANSITSKARSDFGIPDKGTPAGPNDPAQPDSSAIESALQQALLREDQFKLDLARRLHRDVAGNLVGCTALSEMIRHQTGPQSGLPASITETLARIDTALRDTLQMVRSIAEEQFPPVLNAFGLSTALQQFVKHTASGFSGALLLHMDEGDLGLDPARRLNLFRILQGIIHRCVAEARASIIEISCVAANDHLECTIEHDGRPNLWVADRDDEDLALISARCALLGCTLQTTPSPTRQTPRLTLSVPCGPKSA